MHNPCLKAIEQQEFNKPLIIETVVYCGRLKEYRILNVTTGTVYSSRFDTEEQAIKAIDDDAERAGCVVKYVNLREINQFIQDLGKS